jgi:hypothetical protein
MPEGIHREDVNQADDIMLNPFPPGTTIASTAGFCFSKLHASAVGPNNAGAGGSSHQAADATFCASGEDRRLTGNGGGRAAGGWHGKSPEVGGEAQVRPRGSWEGRDEVHYPPQARR